MHESHLIKPIIKGIEEHARVEGGKKVTSLKLKVGDLTCVKEDSFKETFRTLAKGTMLESAELELVFFQGSRIEVISFDIE